jgi:hypothetical protein
MMRTGALPLGQQLLLDIFAPPVITAAWWLLSRGWISFLVTTDSRAVRGWAKSGLLIVLIGAYIVMFGITAYGYFS